MARSVRLTFAAVSAVLLSMFPVNLLATPSVEEIKAAVDHNVAKHFSQDSQVGVVIGLIKDGHEHVWAYGKTAVNSSQIPNADTIFEMGSITKTFTATLLALEVERGRVRLTDTVEMLWPELAGSDTGRITLESLATHHSGLPRMPDNFPARDPLDPYADYGADLFLAFLRSHRQGESAGPYPYLYSNVGMALLGHILAEKLNRETFSAYLQRNILTPLGMQDTATAITEARLPRAAQGHNSFLRPVPFWRLNVMEPAGVLKTTMRDLLRYAAFQIEPGETELGRAVRMTQEPRTDSDNGARVGLAWDVSSLGEHRVIAHGGATGGFRANVIVDVGGRMAAVSLVNTEVSPRCVLAPVFTVDCAMPDWLALTPDELPKFLGSYFSAELAMNLRVYMDNGFLGIHPENQTPQRLWAKTNLIFQVPSAEAMFTFHASPTDDEIDGFVLTQAGRSIEFVKTP